MIINHEHPKFQAVWNKTTKKRIDNKWNGGYFYSKEICENIIPKVKTDRNWITVNIQDIGCNHSIFFVHNNLRMDYYDHLRKYDDLIMVCGIPETCNKVKEIGIPVYLPLNVDVMYVKSFQHPKTKKVAFTGRAVKRKDLILPDGIDYIENLDRESFLNEMASYEKIYAVGRIAIEAKVLGCEILPYDTRFPDPDIWQVVDNSEAAQMLQVMVNRYE